ncbi:hypothetical protein M514_25975, partial [Trichuris suis]
MIPNAETKLRQSMKTVRALYDSTIRANIRVGSGTSSAAEELGSLVLEAAEGDDK